METIRNYLENMFLNLPNTPEVYKAKNELWQMMEDKYTELKAEGKSENEAVGIVISEFGNLDELAADLGIASFMHNPQMQPTGRPLSLEDAKAYLKDSARHAYRIGLGVMLCIISCCGPIFFDAIGGTYFHQTDLLDAIGVTVMFLLIAIAVGLFIYSGVQINRWEYLQFTLQTMLSAKEQWRCSTPITNSIRTMLLVGLMPKKKRQKRILCLI